MSLLPALFLVPTILVGPAAEAPPPSDDQLNALSARLAGSDAADRLAAARAIAELPEAGFDRYALRLKRPVAVATDTFRKLILEAWGQVPNPNYVRDGNLWLRKPDLPWKAPKVKKGEPRPKRPPLHDPETTDWLQALAELDIDGNPTLAALPDARTGRAEALLDVALLRALARTGRTDALEPIFDFAFEQEGVFRDECGRMIRQLGAQAIPGLILRMRTKGKGPEVARRRRYAGYQLDRMDRGQPQKAIRTAPDDRIRAQILHAYGEVRALDAVDAVLAEIDHPSRAVRTQARWAWLRYVTGPPPPEPPRRHRKLPGGHEESVEKEDYLSYRELALLALVKKLAELHGDPDCSKCPRDVDKQIKIPVKANAEAMTREVFDYYDRIRAATWDTEFEAARTKAAAGDLDGAIAGFSWILAHDPLYGRRGEVADLFFQQGDRLVSAGDEERGEKLLREAIALDPDSPRARKADAALHVREGQRRSREGIDAVDDFRRALELDPDNREARRALDDAGAQRRREHRLQESVLAAGGLALLLLALGCWRLLRR